MKPTLPQSNTTHLCASGGDKESNVCCAQIHNAAHLKPKAQTNFETAHEIQIGLLTAVLVVLPVGGHVCPDCSVKSTQKQTAWVLQPQIKRC